jgi:alcohol dehydrogenase (cytochrome c)
MRTFLLWATLGTASLASAQSFADLVKAGPPNWFSYSGSFGAQRHSLLQQINTGTIAGVAPKWIYHIAKSEELEGVPIVADGVMYVSQMDEVDALDARTGRLIWQYQRRGVGRGHNRGLAVYEKRIYLGTSDASVVALDALTGGVIWDHKMPGEQIRYQGGAPLVVRNKVIIGGYGRSGFVDAYDTKTGEHLWRWSVLPKLDEPGGETWAGSDPMKFGGGPTWLSGTYDPELNLVYWGTGQANPDFVGDIRKGDNLYTECVVALDADSGKVKWYFQFTPHDVHDYDAVEIPMLVDATYEGQPRKLMVQANRNGYYYVLDRTNGKFLHGTPFVKSINWAKGLTPEGRPLVDETKSPSVLGTEVCPSTAGATNWPSPAYNPDTHYFYVIATEGCSINYKASDKFQPSSPTDQGTSYVEGKGEQAHWQSYVRALDLTTGKQMWEFKLIGTNHYGPGLLSTAGGLIFAGDNQGIFSALDARTGKSLWHFSVGEKITASPMAYAVNGKEYVALLAGPNVVVFGLPDSP